MNKEKLKSLNKKEVIVISSFILLFFVLFLINITLKNTHAFYNYNSEWIPIFTGKVGNFTGKGDTSPLERNTDVNLLYYVQNLTNPKEYVISSNKPVWTIGYKLDEDKSNCIPTSAEYSDYSIKEDGTVTFSAILSKPSQVVCRIYYSLVGADNDVVIYALQENTNGGVTFEDKKYDVVSTMPTSGYTYYKATCSNSTSATDISYTTSTGFKVTTSGPNICNAYFKKN